MFRNQYLFLPFPSYLMGLIQMLPNYLRLVTKPSLYVIILEIILEIYNFVSIKVIINIVIIKL